MLLVCSSRCGGQLFRALFAEVQRGRATVQADVAGLGDAVILILA
jgi:hypothetical protein